MNYLLCLVLMSGCATTTSVSEQIPNNPATKPLVVPGEISIDKLQKVYQENVLRFNKEYDGKIVTAHGKFSDVVDSSRGYMLRFDSDVGRMMFVYCFLSPESLDKAAALTEGQKIHVRGIIESETISIAKYIRFTDCEIQDSK